MIIRPSLSDLVTILYRRKILAGFVAICVGGAGAAYLWFAVPNYRSEASIVVRFDDYAIPGTNMARDSKPTVTATNDRHEVVLAHSDIMRSPDVLRSVIESVGLQKAYPAIYAAPPGRVAPMEQAVAAFEKDLIAEPEINGDVIYITLMNPNPQIAQTMVQKLIESYMRREGEIFSASEFEFQSQQAENAAKRLNTAQADLRNYKDTQGISSFEDQLASLIKQRGDLNANLQSTQVAHNQAEQRRDELKRLILTVRPTISNSSGEKYRSADDAQAKLADLQLKEKEMLATYRGDSPMLAQLHAQIASAQADAARRRSDISGRDSSEANIVYQNIQTDLLRATAEASGSGESLSILTNQLGAIDQKMASLESSRVGLNDRTRVVQLADDAYRALSLHLEDARVAENRLRDRISHGAVVTKPTLPYRPASPRYTVMSISFALMAGLAGTVAAFFAELVDDRIISPKQVSQAFGIPVLATFDAAS